MGTELGGKNLAPGVYASGTFGLTAGAGPLTLTGGASDVWVFKAASTLITGAGSEVRLSGGAQACNIYWQVGSSATLGASSTFQGTVLANTTISVGNSATVAGRLLAGAVAGSGAVTLDNDTIAVSVCALPPATSTATTVAATATPTATLPPVTATAVAATATAIAATATAVAPATATALAATATAIAPATATAIAATPTAVAPATATAIAATPTAVVPTATTVPETAAPETPVETPVVIIPTPAAPIALPRTGDGGCSDSPSICGQGIAW